MKSKMLILLCMVLITGMISCTKKNDGFTGKVTLVVKSSGNQPVTTLKSGFVGDSVTLTDFMVHVREIEFEFEDEMEDDIEHDDSIVSDIELEGPFVLDLLNDRNTLYQTLATVELPNAAYDEIEFKLSPETGADVPEDIKNRSVYLAGTIGAVPFVMWHYSDEEVEIEFPDSSSFALNSDDLYIYIDAHLDQITTGLESLDLSQVTDGNGNGTIEVGPDDEDGSEEFADWILHFITESFDLDEDDDNENDDDHD